MSLNGHPEACLDQLECLPRQVYGQAESLPNIALGYRHRHPWGNSPTPATASCACTRPKACIWCPQRAVWIAAQVPHRVVCEPNTCIRSLYIEPAALPWPAMACRVVVVEPLLGELIQAFSQLPVHYDESGADGRLVQVLLDRLASAQEEQMLLPLLAIATCVRSAVACKPRPTIPAVWPTGRCVLASRKDPQPALSARDRPDLPPMASTGAPAKCLASAGARRTGH